MKTATKTYYSILFFSLFITFNSFAQTKGQKEKIIAATQTYKLQDLAQKLNQKHLKNKAKALALAKIHDWPEIIEANGSYSSLEGVTPNNTPIYYTTYNKGAGVTSRAHQLYTGGSLGLNIHGENMLAAIWDGGAVFTNHELFTGRVIIKDGTNYISGHATHVAGTIMGTDKVENTKARGMAFKAKLHSYDWVEDKNEVAVAAAEGLLLSNHSYGYNPSSLEDYQFGKYDNSSLNFDEIMFNAPYYQFVCAAGNSRGYYNTSKAGYDLLTGHALSKNGITVAAVETVANYASPEDVKMSSFCSWGPTDDGRIKPDICTKGVNTYSAIEYAGYYGKYSGTSMASPNITGTLLLLQQHYNDLNNTYMRAATLRGLMIHTADEAGNNAGPDYEYGWGLINAKSAATVISNKEIFSHIEELSLQNGNNYTFTVKAKGDEPLKISLCWTDPVGSLPSDAIDDNTPLLVNDLDISITQLTDTFLPWKLNPANPSVAAIKGDNIVDNIEKIEIDNASGEYTVTISHKGNLLNNLQNYSLIISGVLVNDFWFTKEDSNLDICETQDSLVIDFKLSSIDNFVNTVNFSAISLPTDVTATFSPVSLNGEGVFTLTLHNLTTLNVGRYPIEILGETTTGSFNKTLFLTITSDNFVPVTLITPENTAIGVPFPIQFSWIEDANAEKYDIEIATDTSFTNIIKTDVVAYNSYSINYLEKDTDYFWRVRAVNDCDIGSFSSIYSFKTICLSRPTGIYVEDLTFSTLTIGWESNTASSWEIEFVPQGDTPSGNGVLVNDNIYTLTGLSSGSFYDIYIRTACGDNFSDWSWPRNFSTKFDYCGGDHFYDDGGPLGNYLNGGSITTTIYPENVGERIKAVFNSFDLDYNDYLKIYNGPNTSYPLIIDGRYYNIPETVTSSDTLTGALTFQLRSVSGFNFSFYKIGWDATIICEPMPACPDTPNGFQLINATPSTLAIEWMENSGATSWEIELVQADSTPTGTGVIITANPYTAIDLQEYTAYDIYLRSICGNGTSDWIEPITFQTNCNSVSAPLYENFNSFSTPSCWLENGSRGWKYTLNTPFYYTYPTKDHSYGEETGHAWIHTSLPHNGGNTNYLTTVLTDISSLATPSLYFALLSQNKKYDEFNTFSVEAWNGEMWLSIFTHEGITANNEWEEFAFDLLSYDLPDEIKIRFSVEESTVNHAKYNYIYIDDIRIGEMPTCFNMTSMAMLEEVTHSSLKISWVESGDIDLWEVKVVPEGIAPMGAGVFTADTAYTATGLEADSNYDFYIRSICSDTSSYWTTPYTFRTSIDYCSGIHFYDPGGSVFPYSSDQFTITTIAPTEAGERVRAVFNFFELGSVDYLNIYNGKDNTYPLLFSGTKYHIPQTVVANEIGEGILTFEFTANGYSAALGWDASIICEPTPSCQRLLTPITLTDSTTSTLTFEWESNDTLPWEVEWVLADSVPTGVGIITNNSYYTATDLQKGRNYQVYIRSICAEMASDWVQSRVFQTSCEEVITSLYENFELPKTPPCWMESGEESWNYSINSYTPTAYAGDHTPGANTHYAWIDGSAPYGVGHTSYLTTVPIDISSHAMPFVQFAVFSQSKNTMVEFNTLRVEIWNGFSWINIFQLQGATANNDWEVFTIDLSPLSLPDEIILRFLIEENSEDDSRYNDILIDDILVDGMTGCNFPPTMLTLISLSSSSLTFEWIENGEAESWEIVAVPTGEPNNEMGEISQNTPYTATGLQSDTNYDIYIRSVCSVFFSEWIGPFTFKTQSNYCGIHFYDTGGLSENYLNEEMTTTVIYPENAGERVKAIFNTFELESCCDYLTIYNGPDNTYPVLFSEEEESAPDTIASTEILTGALTFEFISDETATFPGWDATILCEPIPICAAQPTNITLVDATRYSLTLFWAENSNATSWEIELVFQGETPTGTGVTVDNNPYTQNGLQVDTNYDIYIRSICNESTSAWSNPATFKTSCDILSAPYFENFPTNSIPDCWMEAGAKNWKYDTNAGEYSSRTKDFTYGVETNYAWIDASLSTADGEGYTSYLTSPLIDISNISVPAVQFAVLSENSFYYGDFSTLTVQVLSANLWQTIFILAEETENEEWQVFTFNLSEYNLSNDLSIRFSIEEDIPSTSSKNDILIDDFRVFEMPGCLYSPSHLTLVNVTKSDLTFKWTENSNATSWEVTVVREGEIPAIGVSVNDSIYTATDLESDRSYDVYIRSTCSNDNSTWIGPYTFSTLPDFCSGRHFYDSGGALYKYSTYYDEPIVTIYPDNPEDRVRVVFNLFDISWPHHKLYIYNGPDNTYPVLFSGSDFNNFPDGIASTEIYTGALTFELIRISSSSSKQGWNATIYCEPLPACPNPPSVVTLTDSTTTTLAFNWLESNNATSWELEFLEQGATPTGAGMMLDENAYTASNLTPNNQYDVYIRSLCTDGNSEWAGPFTFSTTPDYCAGDHFYDSGGTTANYSNSESITTTIFPDNVNDRIRVYFHSFDVYSYDYLKIYNGANDSYPILAQGSYNGIQTSIASTNEETGALTFVFTSNSWTNREGWDASIICEPFPACPNPPTNITLLAYGASFLTFNWTENDNATSWEVKLVPSGEVFSGDGELTNTNFFTATNLDINTSYDIYVRSICTDGYTDWAIASAFKTQGDYCAGDHFYDSGGPSGHYENNEYITTTIYPDNDGDRIKAIFNYFYIYSPDTLTIYNGPDDSYPILFSNNVNNSLSIVNSTEETTGALTFTFKSNASGVSSGWDATIICEPMPSCLDIPTEVILTNATTSSLTFSWEGSGEANSWEIELISPDSIPTGNGVVISDSFHTIQGLTDYTTYNVYIRSICSGDYTEWVGPFLFTTLSDYCGGTHFYDSGGASGNYANNESTTTTIYPDNNGDRVRVDFNTFIIYDSNDSLIIYDGPDDSYPLLFAGTSSISPEMIASREETTGALTFVFTSDSLSNSYGWDATITCEPLPVCPGVPIALILEESTTASLSFSWLGSGSATSWEIEILPLGSPPTGIGVITNNTPYTTLGLTANSSYDIYIRSICTDGVSDWSNAFRLVTKANYCAGDHFYDSGGPSGSYENNESITTTIYPDNIGDRVKAVFNSFQTVYSDDKLKVYDGPDSSYPLLTYGYGDTSPGTVFSTEETTGALTFVFTSNSSGTDVGWDATISCAPLPPCSDIPTAINLISATTTSLSFSWEGIGDATSWEIEILPTGIMPTGIATVINENPYTFSGLTHNTSYDIYIRSFCFNGYSEWSTPFTLQTKPDYCLGDHFYDSGGPSGSYGDNESTTTTIYPDNTGDRVRVVFNTFQTASSSDILKIYDGPNAEYPLLSSVYSNNSPPMLASSEANTGALTFVFTSNSNSNTFGWDATIICEPFPFCPYIPTEINLISATTSSLSFSWEGSEDATFWEIEILPTGTMPTGIAPIVNENPYTITGLMHNTSYDIYIRSFCLNQYSEWSNPFTLQTKLDYCIGNHFYDSGGASGNYENNESITTTIYPDNIGDRVRVVFNTFQTAGSSDVLNIYDGPNASYPLLFSGYDNNSPSTLASSEINTGALTFVFTSDANSNALGWDATIICEPLPVCPDIPTAIILEISTAFSLTFSWEESEDVSLWEIEITPTGIAPTGTGVLTSNNPYTSVDVEENTAYDIYIRSICAETNTSAWSNVVTFQTDCNIIATPFYENFESVETPFCWIEEGDENWNYNTNAEAAAENAGDYTEAGGTNYAWIDGSSPNGIGHSSTLTTVPINISNLPTPALQFALFSKNELSADYNTIEVSVLTPSEEFTLLHLQGETANEGWKVFTIDLSSYDLSDVITLKFSIEENSLGVSAENDILIDDIRVDDLLLLSPVQTNKLTKGGFNYYPNPVTETLHITSIENMETVSVYDIYGRLVYHEKDIDSKKYTFDMSKYPSALYYFKVNLKEEADEYIFIILHL